MNIISISTTTNSSQFRAAAGCLVEQTGELDFERVVGAQVQRPIIPVEPRRALRQCVILRLWNGHSCWKIGQVPAVNLFAVGLSVRASVAEHSGAQRGSLVEDFAQIEIEGVLADKVPEIIIVIFADVKKEGKGAKV